MENHMENQMDNNMEAGLVRVHIQRYYRMLDTAYDTSMGSLVVRMAKCSLWRRWL